MTQRVNPLSTIKEAITEVISIEVLYSNKQRAVLCTKSILSVAQPDAKNYGPLRIGSGGNYALMIYSYFDRIQAQI
jgi:hypothetical protein